MIKKKFFRTLCLSAAFLPLMSTGLHVRADSFLNPARGAYSTEKTLDRPFLQSTPLPRVWQTDPSSEKFRNALKKELSPETQQERLIKASLWQDRATGFQTDFQRFFIKEPRKDLIDIANVLNDLIPVVRKGSEKATEDSAELTGKYENYFDDRMNSDVSKWHTDMPADHAYAYILDEIMPLYLEMKDVEKYLAEKGRRETEIALDHFDVSLSRSENIYLPETRLTKMMMPLDEAVWALMFNDLLDISTGTNTLMFDENYQAGDERENISRSASLLDTVEKNDHIQEDGFKDSRRKLIKKLKKKAEKDVR